MKRYQTIKGKKKFDYLSQIIPGIFIFVFQTSSWITGTQTVIGCIWLNKFQNKYVDNMYLRHDKFFHLIWIPNILAVFHQNLTSSMENCLDYVTGERKRILGWLVLGTLGTYVLWYVFDCFFLPGRRYDGKFLGPILYLTHTVMSVSVSCSR